jgi:hypothetical protein
MCRDLSRGDFTRDNQKRLEGFQNVEADVFSAWITGDSRLIYVIDSLNDVESGVCDYSLQHHI